MNKVEADMWNAALRRAVKDADRLEQKTGKHTPRLSCLDGRCPKCKAGEEQAREGQ